MAVKPFYQRTHVRAFAVVSIASLILGIYASNSARATVIPVAFEMYMDAPFVENSYVYTEHPNEPKVSFSNFDGQSLHQPCSVAGATTTLLTAGIGCLTQNDPNWGGAITQSSDPVVGNLPSPAMPSWLMYAQANGSDGVRLDFATPQRYLGVWWSAGSNGNLIKFYKDGTLVGNTSANDVSKVIDTQTRYSPLLYRGNPATWSQSGTSYFHTGPYWQNENFVYLHFFAQGNVTFDRVELSAPGNGFEFDNLVTSDLADLTPSNRLEHVRSVRSTPAVLSFDANGGSGTLPNQEGWEASLPSDICPDYYGGACINSPGDSWVWQFDSWNTAADGSGQTYKLGRPCWWPGCTPDPGIPYPFEEDAILYAQWVTYLTVNQNPTDAWLNDNSYWYSAYMESSQVKLGLGQSYTLPNDQEVADRPPLDGWHISQWIYQIWDDNSQQMVDVVAGVPGDVLTSTQIVNIKQNAYELRAVWVQDSNGTPPAPHAIVDPTVPTDPRALTINLPPMPLTDATTASVCVDEVDAAHTLISSNISVVTNSPEVTSRTPRLVLSAPTPLTSSGSRYLRFRVAADVDTSCNNANEYFIELRPLNLSNKRSSNADLTKR